MNEVTHMMEQERAANMDFAAFVLRDYFDTVGGATVEQISRSVFNATECGAWVKVNDDASITFGSIVEGSDAEFTCDPIQTIERDEISIQADIKQAIEWLEGECAAAWHEANT